MDSLTFEQLARLGLPLFGFVALALVGLLLSSFVKIATVLSILRLGLGFANLPSAFVTGGLALALSLFVMYPTLERSVRAMEGEIKGRSALTDAERGRALDAGVREWKIFVAKYVAEKDRESFVAAAITMDKAPPENKESYRDSWRILVPAFMVSQLSEAFKVGFALLLPLILIDLLVGTVVSAVGFEGVNTHLLSLPIKLLVFVVVGGWGLITSNLVLSFQ